MKTLAIATTLDVDIVGKIANLKWPTVKEYWDEKGLYSSRGYDRSPKQKQYSADFLKGLPDFERPSRSSFQVTESEFENFSCTTAHMPRSPELYKPPILIVPESPGWSHIAPKSWLLRISATFRSSYYAFSGQGSSEGDLLVALLHLITHSELFAYHVLLTSSKIGAERRTFQKRDLESFPFPDPCGFPESRKTTVHQLSNQLETLPEKPWRRINDFVFDLYGLDKYDRQVVTDTLKVSAPFKKARQCANTAPSKNERAAFCSELQRLLAPSFDMTGEEVIVSEINRDVRESLSPWHCFSITTTTTSQQMMPDGDKLVPQVIKEANTSGCSRAIVHGKGHLLIGVLGQYRYWTLSRARLCALDILRNHLDAFPLERS